MLDRLIRPVLKLSPLAGLMVAVPAHAADRVVLPEPGTLTLLGIASAGVVIGRRMSRKKPPVE